MGNPNDGKTKIHDGEHDSQTTAQHETHTLKQRSAWKNNNDNQTQTHVYQFTIPVINAITIRKNQWLLMARAETMVVQQ